MPTSKPRGFTLIELLITISIIAVLAAIGLVVYSTVMKQGRDSKRQSDLRSLQSSLEQYYADQGFYPTEVGLNTLLAGFPPPAFTSSIGNPSPPPTPKTYQNTPPQDPQEITYKYDAIPDSCDNSTSNKCSNYCLYAKMENSSSPLPSVCPAYPPGGYNFALTPP